MRNAVHGSTHLQAHFVLGLAAVPLHAQQDSWEQAVLVLRTAFTVSIVKCLSLATVGGGLMFAFGEGQKAATPHRLEHF
jgi:hypothetical protein